MGTRDANGAQFKKRIQANVNELYLYAPLPPQLTKVNDLYKYSIVNDFLVLEPRFDFMETKFYTQVYMRMCLNIYIDCLR